MSLLSFDPRGQGDARALKLEAAVAAREFGVAMRNWSVFSGTEGLQELVEREAAVLVPGNAFKWDHVEATQGVFDFTQAEAFVAWADARGIDVVVHTLVWGTVVPAWLPGTITSGNWQSLLDGRISSVLTHLDWATRGWDVDVVNEAFRAQHGMPGGFRNNFFYQVAGPDYVPYSFERARAHSASARLFLNEFQIEDGEEDADTRRGDLLAAVQDWLAQGVPIDGVGMQAHLRVQHRPAGQATRDFIAALRGLGLDVVITELDFREIAQLPGSNDAKRAAMGSYLRTFLDLAFDAGVSRVISWGATPHDWAGMTAGEPITATPWGASPFHREPIWRALLQSARAAGALPVHGRLGATLQQATVLGGSLRAYLEGGAPSAAVAWADTDGSGVLWRDADDATPIGWADVGAAGSIAGTLKAALQKRAALSGSLTARVIEPVVVGPGSVTRSIAAGADDGYEILSTGVVELSTTEIGVTNNRVAGFRFTGLAIPPGATIIGAELRLVANATNTAAALFLIDGQAAGDAPAFTTAAGDLTGRARTSAGVAWNPVPSMTGGVQYLSPDLSTIIGEIVGGGGWASGNALALFITGDPTTTNRRLAPFENINGYAVPTLFVEWS